MQLPPSPLLQNILLLCEYTDPLGESFPPRLTWTLNYWKTTLRSHVYKGFPFINLSTTPIFAYLTYLVARCKTFRLPRLKWALNYWKTSLNSHVMQGPPPSPLLQHILLLCEYSGPLGESIPRRLTWTLNY